MAVGKIFITCCAVEKYGNNERKRKYFVSYPDFDTKRSTTISGTKLSIYITS